MMFTDPTHGKIQAGPPPAHPSGILGCAGASKATTPNPKDLFGSLKVSLTKLPAVAVAHAAHAMMDGAEKYGPYNWRDKAVLAHIYCDAAKRHIDAWFEGERDAQDSFVHHLGHAIACCAILLDAEANGGMIDDRPKKTTQDALAQAYALISEKIQYKRKEKEQARVDKSWVDAAYAGLAKPAPVANPTPDRHYTYRRQPGYGFAIYNPDGQFIRYFVSEEAAQKACGEYDRTLHAGMKPKAPRYTYRQIGQGYQILDAQGGEEVLLCWREGTAALACEELNRTGKTSLNR